MLDIARGTLGRHRLASLSAAVAALGVGLLMASVSISYSAAPSKEVIVARVNDVSITKSELDRVVSEYRRQTRKKVISDEEVQGALQSLIRRHLILQHPSVEALKQDKEIVERVKEYEKGIIIARFLQDDVGSKLKVTEDDLKNYYDKNRYKFSAPPKVKAKHILLRTREDAEEVQQKLQQGEDFSKLAKEYSIDLPMALEGGSMGTIEKGRALPALEKVLFLLNVGETSDIVETKFGFHILTVDEIVPASFKAFGEVRDDIKKTIIRQKEAKAFDEMAAKLEKDAKIKVYEEQLK